MWRTQRKSTASPICYQLKVTLPAVQPLTFQLGRHGHWKHPMASPQDPQGSLRVGVSQYVACIRGESASYGTSMKSKCQWNWFTAGAAVEDKIRGWSPELEEAIRYRVVPQRHWQQGISYHLYHTTPKSVCKTLHPLPCPTPKICTQWIN